MMAQHDDSAMNDAGGDDNAMSRLLRRLRDVEERYYAMKRKRHDAFERCADYFRQPAILPERRTLITDAPFHSAERVAYDIYVGRDDFRRDFRASARAAFGCDVDCRFSSDLIRRAFDSISRRMDYSHARHEVTRFQEPEDIARLRQESFSPLSSA